LSDGPQSVASLAGGFDVTRQAISKHLRVISAAGLARSEARGRETVWQLDPQGLAEATRYLSVISKDWDDKLRRLKDLVETD
jgi:DNA-binding transcriptional ArsR family regulator